MYIAEAAEGKGKGKAHGKHDNPDDDEVITWYIL